MAIEAPDLKADSARANIPDLLSELKAVRDSTEELYLLLDHIWRNRDELEGLLSAVPQSDMEEREDEIIVCCHCDASPPSLGAAIRAGWTDFQYDRNANWNYSAICPDCRRKNVDDTSYDRRQPRTAAATTGTDEEITPVRSDEVAETIACARCDADAPESLAAALQEGWTDLCRADGQTWNYLGLCPTCQAEEQARNKQQDEETPDEQKRLFA
jgi:hypothetical protein